MKKLNYLFLGAATLLLASCSQEDLVNPSSGNTATITLDLSIPMIQTRAISDGSEATNLQVVVYEQTDQQGGIKYAWKEDVKTLTDKRAKVTLDLIKDHSYSVALWAYASGNEAYSVAWGDNDSDVAFPVLNIDYDKAYANDEKMDAFYAFLPLGKAEGDRSIGVQLKRPFAQINLGTSDIEKAKEKGYVVSKSSVKVAKGYSSFDIAKGTIPAGEEAKEIEFKMALIPNADNAAASGSFPVDGYEYMAMAYVLMPSDQELVTVTFSYIGEGEDETAAHTREVPDVPLKQNRRTNVFGRVLTTQADLEVELGDAFEGEENLGSSLIDVYNGVKLDKETQTFFISNKEGLKWVAEIVNKTQSSEYVNSDKKSYGAENLSFVDQTLRLTSNLDLKNESWTPIGYQTNSNGSSTHAFSGTFDGAGYTISNLKVETTENSTAGLFGAIHYGAVKNLTLENVDINGHYKAGALTGDGVNLQVDNCCVKGGKVTSTPWIATGKSNSDDANNIGGIVGYLDGHPEWSYVRNTTVDGLTITAFRKVAGIAGVATNDDDVSSLEQSKSGVEVSGCTVANTTIIADMTDTNYDGYAKRVPDIGVFVGITGTNHNFPNADKVKIENNTSVNTTTEVKVADGISLASIIPNLKEEATLNLGETSLSIKGVSFPEGLKLNFVGAGAEKTSITDLTQFAAKGADISFENLTLKVEESTAISTSYGFKESKSVSLDKVDAYGEFHIFDGDATITNCNFYYGGGKNNTDKRQGLQIETSGDVVIEDCVFDTSCKNPTTIETKGILVYGANNTEMGNITLNNVEFKVEGANSTKAAVEIHSEKFTKAGVINLNKVSYPEGKYISLWREIVNADNSSNGSNGQTTSFFTVYENGVKVERSQD